MGRIALLSSSGGLCLHFTFSSICAGGIFQIIDHHLQRVKIEPDRGPRFSSAFWADFCKLLWATLSLSSGFHPQSNGQTERKNQDIEVALWCMASWNSTSWSPLLVWVEYAHNSLTSSATGLSTFQCVYSYQPPSFPVLNAGVSCPSALAYLRHCQRIWTQAQATLLRSVDCYAMQTNRCRTPAPTYLSTRDLPLWVESKKLAQGSWVRFPSRGSSASASEVNAGLSHLPHLQGQASP